MGFNTTFLFFNDKWWVVFLGRFLKEASNAFLNWIIPFEFLNCSKFINKKHIFIFYIFSRISFK